MRDAGETTPGVTAQVTTANLFRRSFNCILRTSEKNTQLGTSKSYVRHKLLDRDLSVVVISDVHRIGALHSGRKQERRACKRRCTSLTASCRRRGVGPSVYSKTLGLLTLARPVYVQRRRRWAEGAQDALQRASYACGSRALSCSGCSRVCLCILLHPVPASAHTSLARS